MEELIVHRPKSGDFILVTTAFKSEGLFFKSSLFFFLIISCAFEVDLHTILVVSLYLQYCFPNVSDPNTDLIVSEC